MHAITLRSRELEDEDDERTLLVGEEKGDSQAEGVEYHVPPAGVPYASTPSDQGLDRDQD